MSVLIPLGYMGLIFILSLIPDTEDTGHFMDLFSPNIQNFLHILAFGFLAMLWLSTLRSYRVTELRGILFAFAITFFYGVLIELSQVLIPGRVPSILDLLFDAIGILLFMGFYCFFKGLGNFRIAGPRF